MKQFFFFAALVLVTLSTKAQLVINEVSQGTGNAEYVELLVTGNPTCGSANTVDIRGWIIDDNNSWHGSSGIAGGHVRFDSIPQWANVKIGSLILVYNDADITNLTNDETDANNDFVYILPVSSSRLQKNSTLPTSGGNMTTYAVPGTVYTTGNTITWTVLGMANSGDAFHTVSPANYATAYHAIGYGNTSTAVDIYFTGSQGGKVIYMANLVDNDPFNQANYIDTVIAGNETPGAPNNTANAAWIASLNNNGQPYTGPVVTLSNLNPLSCSNSTTVLVATTSTQGALYTWSNGITTANDTVTTGGTYYVTVTNAAQTCSTVDSITITSSSTLSISTSSTPTTCGSNNGTATVTVNNGTASGYLWSNNGNTATISALAAGNYTVTVTGTGNCSASASVTVSSSTGGTPVTITANQTSFCSQDSAQVCAPTGNGLTYLWNTGAITTCITVKQAGNYYVTVTDNNGCSAESNHLAISVLPSPPVSISISGDTLTSYNASSYQWYRNGILIPGATSAKYVITQPGSYTVVVTGPNGCTAQSLPVVTTGIDVVTLQQQFNIYPNPLTGGNWTIEAGKDLLGAKLAIYDNNGRLVYNSEITTPTTVIEAEMARGVYWLKVSSGQNSFTNKLVKL